MTAADDLYPPGERVERADTLELIGRYNELQRVVPIYRQALEQIAGEHEHDPRQVARRALRDAGQAIRQANRETP